jgi:hypothetical protein
MSTQRLNQVLFALLFALVLIATGAMRGLYADGAFFLLRLIERGTWFDFDPARTHAQWMGQGPPWLFMQLGIRDVKVLARAYSFGLLGLPALFYALALWRTRLEPVLHIAVAVLTAVVFLNTQFFAVGEYNIAYALATWVAALLLSTRPLGWLGQGTLLLVLTALIRAYEVMLSLGPALALLAWVRARRLDPEGSRERLILPVVVLAAALGIWVAIQYGLRVRSDSIVQSSHRLKGVIHNGQLLISLLFAATFALAALERPRAGLHRILSGVAVALPGLLLLPWVWAKPSRHHDSRAWAGLALTLGLLWTARAAWKFGFREGWAERAGFELGRMRGAVILLWLVLSGIIAGHTLGWQRYLRAFESELAPTSQGSGQRVRPWADVSDELKERSRLYGWPWTQPSLSVLMQPADPDRVVIENPPGVAPWQPFSPQAPVLTLPGWSWSRSLKAPINP